MTWELPAHCAVCEGPPLEWYFRSEEWAVARCPRCGLGQSVDVPTPEVLRGGIAFPWQDEVVIEAAARRPMYADRVRRLETASPDRTGPLRWLDVGCGGGGLLGVAAERGHTVEGVEPGPAAGWARKAGGLPIHRGYLADRQDQLEHTPFDVVSYFHVLEHVLDPRAELLLARRVLAPTGVLAVEVPLFGTLSWRAMRHRHRHFQPHHRWYFTGESLDTLLAQTGFAVVDRRRVPYHISADWLLFRLKVPPPIRRRLYPLTRSLPIRVDLHDVTLALARPT